MLSVISLDNYFKERERVCVCVVDFKHILFTQWNTFTVSITLDSMISVSLWIYLTLILIALNTYYFSEIRNEEFKANPTRVQQWISNMDNVKIKCKSKNGMTGLWIFIIWNTESFVLNIINHCPLDIGCWAKLDFLENIQTFRQRW